VQWTMWYALVHSRAMECLTFLVMPHTSRFRSGEWYVSGCVLFIRNSSMQVSDDSDGEHKCNHTRHVDTKQLDDGTDHTFVSAGRDETPCASFLYTLCPL
jgi:hypothetical protein